MHITVFLFDGVTALDPIGVYDSLARLPDTRITFAAITERTCTTGEGTLRLQPQAALSDVERTDLLIVPGGSAEGLRSCMANDTLKADLRRLDQASSMTASVCTGSLILGAAGLLQGRKATTNWRARDYLPRFGATYTGERVTRDGKYWTAAGVTAGIDLGLRLCEQIAGSELASAIELAMEYAPHPPFGTGNFETSTASLRGTVENVLRG